MTEELIGRVTHYWPRVHAAEIALQDAVLHVGDRVHIHGRDHDVVQSVDSIEVEHTRRPDARPGEPVAIGVADRVRRGDEVWLVRDTGGPKE